MFTEPKMTIHRNKPQNVAVYQKFLEEMHITGFGVLEAKRERYVPSIPCFKDMDDVLHVCEHGIRCNSI